MVFFVCEGCNETLKKNQVDKHAFRCRNCYAVTCVDCQQTFPGDTYTQHTECISEAEKYEGALYQGGKKKKKSPQELWNECIETAIQKVPEAPQKIRSHISNLGQLSNVPRNKNKFSNFIKNSFRLNDDNTINEIWKFLEQFKSNGDSQSLEKEESSKREQEGNHIIPDANINSAGHKLVKKYEEQKQKEQDTERKGKKKEKKRLKREREQKELAESEAVVLEGNHELKNGEVEGNAVIEEEREKVAKKKIKKEKKKKRKKENEKDEK